MSIVKMKKLQLAALGSERQALMKRLQRLGCVELRELPAPEGYLAPLRPGDPEAQLRSLRAQQKDAEAALKALKRYAYEKTGLFSSRDFITEADFFADIWDEARRAAGGILEALDNLNALQGEEFATRALCDSLALWQPLPVPLELRETRSTYLAPGSIPAGRTVAELSQALQAVNEEADAIPAGSDRHKNGLLLVCAKEAYGSIEPVLSEFGFERLALSGRSGTAAQLIQEAETGLERVRREQEETLAYLKECGQHRRLLKLYYDRLTMAIDAAEADQKLLVTQAAFALTGWVDEPHVPALEALLADYCCAYDLSDPAEGDKVPVRLQNNKLTAPLNMVTEMYSLPDYHNVDPNPLIMPFYTIFFGMMFNDLGYGLVFIVLSLVIQKKYRLHGGIKNLMQLMLECGVTTAIMGLLTGSFFGDAIPVVAGMLGHTVVLPALINPLGNPMQVLIISLVCGAVQILFGMGVKAYLLIRDGHSLDALFDVGSWWLLFAGVAVGALGGTWLVAVAGVLALLLTQGRAKPTLVGKLVGGLASLYDITSYFSDVLSYSRIMALMLAGGIVASIVNILGSLFGSVILFIPIFIIGHAFNIGINVIGTYVHAARLQYLEFFGKFYADGGKPFRPLEVKTKYFDIVKEDSIHG